MARPILEVEHFTRRYGDKVAVRDVSLTVEAGDILGFIGHNGAGKRDATDASPPAATAPPAAPAPG